METKLFVTHIEFYLLMENCGSTCGFFKMRRTLNYSIFASKFLATSFFETAKFDKKISL